MKCSLFEYFLMLIENLINQMTIKVKWRIFLQYNVTSAYIYYLTIPRKTFTLVFGVLTIKTKIKIQSESDNYQ